MKVIETDIGFLHIFFAVFDRFLADPKANSEQFEAVKRVAKTRYGLEQDDLMTLLQKRDQLLVETGGD